MSIRETMRIFNKKFENRVLTEVVLLGSTYEKKQDLKQLKGVLGRKLLQEDNESFKPNIYLRDDVFDTLKLCYQVKEIYPETVCKEAQGLRKILNVNGILQSNLVPNITNSTYVFPSTVDVSDQQTFIWTIFFLIFVVILTLVGVDSIDYLNDPLFFPNNSN
jgi:hypothetical protein